MVLECFILLIKFGMTPRNDKFARKCPPKHLDQGWFSQFTKISSFQIYEYFEGEYHFREKQRRLFSEGKIENPVLDYPLLNKKHLDAKEVAHKSLLNTILSDERNLLIRRAYQKKIEEKLVEIQILKASRAKDWSKFISGCKKIYGYPSLKAQGHTAAWLQREFRKAKKGKGLEISKRGIAKLELLIEKWLGKIPKHYRIVKLPTKSLFGKKLKNLQRELQVILKPALARKPPYNAKNICEIFNKAVPLAGISGWEAVVVKSSSISIGTDPSTKKIRIPHKKYLYSSDLRALIVHEIGTHARRQFNGEKSAFSLLSLGLDRYEESEEGLATLKEQLVRDSFDDFSGFPGFLAVCLALGCDGEKRNFRQVYEEINSIFFLLKLIGGKNSAIAKTEAAREAWERSVRTFRGTDCSTPGICFTKDIIYREGNMKLWNFLLKTEINISEFDAGKYDPLNSEHIKLLNSLGIIKSYKTNAEIEKRETYYKCR